MSKPTKEHLQAVHRVLRYLKSATAQGILSPFQSDLILRAYCDADWAACPLTKKSISGFCVLLGPLVISWKAKKQHVVSRSSVESEYCSMAITCCELVWLVRLLSNLGIKVTTPIPLACDSKAALHLARNLVFHERTKHIKIDCHLVCSHVTSRFSSPIHIPSNDQAPDLFTKPLFYDHLLHLCSKLGVSNFLHSAA